MTSSSISRRTFAAAVGLPLAIAPVLAACGGGASAGGTAELRVGFPQDSENYDPHQPPYTVSRAVARQIADTLVDQDPKTGKIVPWLATSWKVSEDSTRFTFTLREDVTFSDGTAFSAQSVKKNFDRIRDLGALAFIGASHLRGYRETIVEDPRTATVVFDGPNAQFLQAATTQTLSMLADATLALKPEEVARGKVIGSGPYTLESYSAGKTLVLKKRADYAWGSAAYANRGAAPFEKITISFIPDATTLAGAASSGQVDWAFSIDASAASAIGPRAQKLEKLYKGIAIPLVPYIYRPIFEDEAVRRAINPATDRQEIVERIFQGVGKPATSVLTADTPGYADMSELLAHDPAKAQRILEDGGWKLGADGIRHKDGKPLRIEIRYADSGGPYEQMFQLLQTQWKKVGIDFALKPVTEAQLSEYSMHDAPYDVSTWSQGRADADVLRVVYSSFYENQSFFYGHPVPELDEALLALQSTIDPEERDAAAAKAQRLILEGGYAFPLFDSVALSAGAKDLTRIALDAENKPAFADFARGK